MNLQKKLALGIIRVKLKTLTLINKRKAGEEAFRLFCTPIRNEPVIESRIFKNAEQVQFILDGKKVCGYRFNHPQHQKVLLLHGFSSYSYKFDQFVLPLLKKQYEVLAFDAPAHGYSEGKTINAVEYAEMIKKIISLFGPVQSFIAHSFGGIAVCLALEQLPHTENTKIVLIAPATETSSAIDGAFTMLGIKNNSLRKSFDEFIFNISGKPTEWYSVRRAIKNIKARVFWIHDEDDEVTPFADVKKVIEDNLPDVKFMITRGLGHSKIYRDATVKKAIIDFL
ncbi:MAG: alpha/beta hydrolase [Ferruginibacter sp.]